MYCGVQVCCLFMFLLCLIVEVSGLTIVTTSNVTEVVKTFPAYIEAASKTFLEKGAAGIVISEQLPNNVWETGVYARTPTVFSYYDL